MTKTEYAKYGIESGYVWATIRYVDGHFSAENSSFIHTDDLQEGKKYTKLEDLLKDS